MYISAHILMLAFVNASVPRRYLGIDLTLISLAVNWLLDVGLVSLFLLKNNSSRLSRCHIIFALYFLLISVPLGILQFGPNLKTVSDIVRLGMFPLKLAALTWCLTQDWGKQLFAKFLSVGSVVCLIATLVTLPVVAVIAASNSGIYFTASPNLMVPMAYALARGTSSLRVIIILVMGFLTGKRALFAGLVIFAALRYKLRATTMVPTLTLIALIVGGLQMYSLDDQSWLYPAVSKAERTLSAITALATNPEQEQMQSFLGSRFVEYRAIVESVQGFEWLFGNGVGFTYDVDFGVGAISEVQTRSDGHFTPLTVISKLGVVGAGFLLALILKPLFGKKPKDKGSLILSSNVYFSDDIARLVVISFLIQSMFSYLLFNNILFALALAWLYRKK